LSSVTSSAGLGRIGRNLGHHGQARAWRIAAAAQDHRLGDARIVGLEAQGGSRSHDLARDLAPPAFEHAGDPAFQPARPHPPLDLDPIAVHGRVPAAPVYVNVL
jgi:hypothetical protein